MVLGESAEMSGERAARSDLRLPGDQQRLFDAAVQTGKPVVVVLVNGRPLDIRSIVDRAPAVLEAWHPGTRGGTAIARVLFGDVNPGGKLPVTWPRSVGQVPIFYAHNTSHGPADQAVRYWDETSAPLFPFGFGLSYTSFDIGAPQLSADSLAPGRAVTVSSVVKNTGGRAGDQVVQLYIHQRAGRASRPVRELKGFQRVTLQPGESKTVSFQITEDSVKYWNSAEKSWVIDPSVFDIWVGSDSTSGLATKLTVTGEPRHSDRPRY
jgi:beta-glucosidase